MPTRRLVVNADDFGLARGVNAGIVEAHESGIVTSASLMVLRPAAREAAALAVEHPRLSVGLHFDDGVGADFSAQLERFRELLGRDPTHVDSHHHSHTHIPDFSALVEPLGVPLRHDGRVTYIGDFWGQPHLDHVRGPFLLRLLDSVDGFTELACHPAHISPDLQSSYLRERETELETLTERGLWEKIAATGIELVSYHNWPG